MLISTLTGLVVGSVSTIFNFGLKFAVDFRHAHLWVVLFLPVAGLAIVFLYRFFHYENNAGTDTVINSIHKDELSDLCFHHPDRFVRRLRRT